MFTMHIIPKSKHIEICYSVRLVMSSDDMVFHIECGILGI